MSWKCAVCRTNKMWQIYKTNHFQKKICLGALLLPLRFCFCLSGRFYEGIHILVQFNRPHSRRWFFFMFGKIIR